jgi:hypothetical protein
MSGSGIISDPIAGTSGFSMAPLQLDGTGAFSFPKEGFGDHTLPAFSVVVPPNAPDQPPYAIFYNGSNFAGSSVFDMAFKPDRSRYVIVGGTGRAAWSNDGYVWNPLSNSSTSVGVKFGSLINIAGIVYGGGIFVAVGGTSTASYSSDGINWTALPSSSLTTGLKMGNFSTNDIAYGNGVYVVVGHSGRASYSSDGINWTALTPGVSTGIKFGTDDAYCVSFVVDRFFVGGLEGKASYSFDGINWTPISIPMSPFGGAASSITEFAGNGSIWLAVGPGVSTFTARAAYSFDAINWTAFDLAPGEIGFADFSDDNPFFYGAADSIAYGNGKFVIVGTAGQASVSSDGLSWTRLPPGTVTGIKFNNRAAYSVVHDGVKFLVSGGNGYISFSFDGINWISEKH